MDTLKRYLLRATSKPVTELTSVGQLNSLLTDHAKDHAVFFVHARVDKNAPSALSNDADAKKKKKKKQQQSAAATVTEVYRDLAVEEYLGGEFCFVYVRVRLCNHS